MPRIAIPVTQVVKEGVAQPSQLSSSSPDQHEFTGNDGRIMLEVTNVGGTAELVTVISPVDVAGLAVADLTVSVPSGSGVRAIGPFPPAVFNQPGTDTVQVNIVTNYMRFRAYRL